MDPRIKKVIDSYKSSDSPRIVGIGLILEELQNLAGWSWERFRMEVKTMLDESGKAKKPN